MVTKKNTRSRIIIAVVIAAVMGFIGYFIYSSIQATSAAQAENLPIVYSLSAEDSALTPSIYRGALRVREVLRSKVRPPINVLAINDQYMLIEHKLKGEADGAFEDLVQLRSRDVHQTNAIVYSSIWERSFEFKYKSGPINRVGPIEMTYWGTSPETVFQNDSTISYYFRCENFSIRHSQEEAIDLYFYAFAAEFDGDNGIPLNISFLKRNNHLYLLLLAPNNRAEKMDKRMLNGIITDTIQHKVSH